MNRYIGWLAAAGLTCASPHVFSVTDDLLAYPQYEIVFSESYISDHDASSSLALSLSPASESTHFTSKISLDASTPSSPSSELSPRLPFSNIPTNDQSDSSDVPKSYERMILESIPYLCSVPSPPPPEIRNTTASHLAAEEETAELARATDRGWDLLQAMSGSCLYFISGWWSYEFCYSQSVKQFHPRQPGGNVPLYPPMEDPTTPAYILGRFGQKQVNRHRLPGGGRSLGGALDGGLPPEAGDVGSTTTIQAKGSSSSRYLSQKLSGGTLCDLTGVQRQVEIQFHCHPQSADRISWIKEVSTCSYLMVVYTPRLCNDAAFLPEREEMAEQVICREVVKEKDEADWRRRKSREVEKKLIGETESVASGNTKSKVMVGDIEVGGMKHVGGDKGWLATPDPNANNLLNGLVAKLGRDAGKGIAHQHTKEEGGAVHKISDKEIKELGIDVPTAKAVIKEMKKNAKGKGWRLEAYDNNGRVEMRGIWEDEENAQGQDVDIVIVDGDEEGGGERSGEGYRDEL